MLCRGHNMIADDTDQHQALWCGNGTKSVANGAAKILTREVHANESYGRQTYKRPSYMLPRQRSLDATTCRAVFNSHSLTFHHNNITRQQHQWQSTVDNRSISISQSRAISRSSSALRHQCVRWYLCMVFQCRIHHYANILHPSGALKYKNISIISGIQWLQYMAKIRRWTIYLQKTVEI